MMHKVSWNVRQQHRVVIVINSNSPHTLTHRVRSEIFPLGGHSESADCARLGVAGAREPTRQRAVMVPAVAPPQRRLYHQWLTLRTLI